MSHNHKPYDEQELTAAEATANALGQLSPAEAARFERERTLLGTGAVEDVAALEQTRRLGQLLRADLASDQSDIDLSSTEARRCSGHIREAVLAALDANEKTLPSKHGAEKSPIDRPRSRIWGWSLVASIAVILGSFAIWSANLDNKQQVRLADYSYLTKDAESPAASPDYFQRESISGNASKKVKDNLAELGAPMSADVPGAPDAAGESVEMKERLGTNGKTDRAEVLSLGGVAGNPEAYESELPSAAPIQDMANDANIRSSEQAIRDIDLYAQDAQSKRIMAGGAYREPSNELAPVAPMLEGSTEKAASPLALSSNQPPSADPPIAFPDPEEWSRRVAGRLKYQPARETDQFGTGGDEMSRGTRGQPQPLVESVPAGTGLTARAATADESKQGDLAAEERDDDGDGIASRIYQEQKEAEQYGYRFLQGRNTVNEAYKSVPENPFWRPIGEEKAKSTFSIDVDTASYANVRRFLNSGSLPPPDAVRLEEFINYFHYEYPQPEDGNPFAVDLKLFGCPWNAQHSLLRVGIRGREIEAQKRPVSNIVYLVDVSGSMSSDDKLPLLKRGLSMMVDHLTENDTVSIVTYAGEAGVRMDPTKGGNKKRILDAIDSLQPGGSTNGAAGIEVAYQLAQQRFAAEGANRVILMTDGDLNVGVTSDDALVSLIKEKAASGVFLTVLGFGTGNLKDAKLEGLADNGNGIYAYIDTLGEAHKVLVEQMSGNLVTIAKDVKIQIEFNPAQVAGYRLIGYENRVMANADFANDQKDAGEIGAGHTVTALYEIVPTGAVLDSVEPSATELRYQTLVPAEQADRQQAKIEARLTDAAASGELAFVSLCFKTPEGTESRTIEFTANSEVTSFSQADTDCRFAAAVAAFGMRLRQSQYAGNITLDAIAEIASAALGTDPNGHRAEFVDLVRRAKSLQPAARE